jgi:uncharacterized protein YdhG (YjbR/CyaY superfamily)
MFSRIEAVSEQEIDAYLAKLEEPKRSTLRELRRTIHEVIPEAEQCISYRMPAFRLHGKVVAGFAAFTNHLSYLPHSGSVLSVLADDLAGYVSTPVRSTSPSINPCRDRSWRSSSRCASVRCANGARHARFPGSEIVAPVRRAGRLRN